MIQNEADKAVAQRFGTTILAARRDLGLSQTQAAAGIGISNSLLGHYEKGKAFPKPAKLTQVAAFYQLSLNMALGVWLVIARAGDEAEAAELDGRGVTIS